MCRTNTVCQVQFSADNRAHFQRNTRCLCLHPRRFPNQTHSAWCQSYPSHIGEHKIAHIQDLTVGYDSRTADNKAPYPKQSGQVITFYLASGGVITFRTSGTEPKIKFYSECRVPLTFALEFPGPMAARLNLFAAEMRLWLKARMRRGRRLWSSLCRSS